jgi:hypothetical protein
MKTQFEQLIARLPRKIFLVMAALVTACIAIDSAFHASHIMVFFSLIVLSVLFLSLYAESEHHKLAVSLICLMLGTVYLLFYPVDFTWWRFTFYSVPMYICGFIFLLSWLYTSHMHHRADHN